jgi:sugar-specific transcriptional regulator TrmB
MTDDLRDTLDRVGDRFNLGEYEIDAYLAVLELTPSHWSHPSQM